MKKETSCNQGEYEKIMKIIDFRLPHKFKKIGYFGAASILVFLIVYKFLGANNLPLILKDVLRTLMLLFLLIASLSKEVIEDEFNKYVKFQSYVLAFVCAAAYCIFLPLITVVLDVIITKVTGDGIISFYNISSFEVIFILMGFQLLYFETIKRLERAE